MLWTFSLPENKKTQITLTEGGENMLHKRLQNVSYVAFTDSSTAADIHNRRILYELTFSTDLSLLL
jgi:hypothetical protein